MFRRDCAGKTLYTVEELLDSLSSSQRLTLHLSKQLCEPVMDRKTRAVCTKDVAIAVCFHSCSLQP